MEIKNKTTILAVVLVVVAFAGWYFMVERGTVQAPLAEQSSLPEQAIQQEGEEEDGEGRIIIVEGGDFYFSPSEISVSPGERVRLVLRNRGTMPHDYVVDGLGATPVIAPGDSAVLEFIAPNNPMVLESYCSVGNHREQGMVGTLKVE